MENGGVYHGQTPQLGAPLQIVASRKTLLTTTKVFRTINQIAVKNFEYKTAEEIESDGEVPSTDAVDKTGVQIGVIAQELQEVRPTLGHNPTTTQCQ